MKQIFAAVVKTEEYGYVKRFECDTELIKNAYDGLSCILSNIIEEFLSSDKGKQFCLKREGFTWDHIFGDIPEELFKKYGLMPIDYGIYDGEMKKIGEQEKMENAIAEKLKERTEEQLI